MGNFCAIRKSLFFVNAFKGYASKNSIAFNLEIVRSKLKSIFMLISMFTAFSITNAQVANYTFVQSTNTYTPISGTNIGTSTWDDNVTAATIPFSFTFNNVSYTSCSVNSNGYLTFGTTTSSSTGYSPISATTGYAGAVSAFARDLINNAAAITTTTLNATPNRIFVIQWNSARRYSGGAIAGDAFNFQVRLYETSNKVEIMYGTCTATSTTSLTHQVGLRGSSNTDFNNRTSTTNWSSTTAGATNSATVTSSNTILPASGLTFTWTPGAVVPPPANDNCAGAIAFGTILTDGSCTTLSNRSTASATASGVTPSGACTTTSGTADDDVWFSFVAPGPSVKLTATYVSGVSDVYWHVFSGSCSTTMTSVLCTDTDAGATITGLTTGSTYYIRLYTWSSAVTTVQNICLSTPPPPPANDNCAGATAFPAILTDGSCSTLSNQSTANATASGVTPTGACTTTSGTADDDVWFSFVAPGPTVVLSATYVSGSSDVYWHVFSGSCSTTMTSVLCTDTDAGATLTGLTTGATYYIRLYTWSSAVTTVQNICLNVPPPVVPATGNATITTCSSTIQDNGNSSNYSNNSNGTLTINPSTPNSLAILTFTEFATESGFDFVTVFDGVGTGGTILYGPASGTLTGASLPVVTSASGSLTIRFTSDASISAAGFTATASCFTIPAPACITSPTSPADGASGIAILGTTLSWPAVQYATGYDVYFDEGASASTLVSSNQAGTSYLITAELNATTLHSWRVVPKNSSGDASGCSTWTFTTANTPPTNDACPGAKVIPSNAGSSGPTLTGSFSNVNAISAGDPANTCQPASDRGIWWSFTPDATASFSFSTCSSVASGSTVPDNVLGIFTSSDGTCGGTFTQVACNDNGGSACSANANQAIISNQILTAGTTYYILVYSNGFANTGNYQIEVSRKSIPPVLSPAPSATVDNTFDLTFTSDPSWESSITAITVGGVALPPAAYIISNGIITLKPSESALLQSVGTKNIVVIASGYADAPVAQLINPGLPFSLNITVQPTAPSVSGNTLATQPRVLVQDQYGNPVPNIGVNAQADPSQTSDWSLGGTVTVTTNASGLAIFTNLTATNLTNAPYTGANIIFTPNAGSGNAQSNPFNLPVPPPAYDACAGAVEIPCDGSVTIDNSLATIDLLPSSSCGSTTATGTHYGFWTKVTPTASGSLTVSTCNTALSTDTYIRIYSGSCGSLTCVSNSSGVGYSDDNCSFFDFLSSATFTATANTTYYILTGLYSSSETTGNITVSVTCPVPPPANDNCSGAEAITASSNANCTNPVSGNTFSATQSQAGCAGTANDDVWYTFEATSGAHTVTVTPGTLSDAVLQVFSGTCSGLTSLSCTDATISTAETVTLNNLNIGQTYYVRVYSWGSSVASAGTFSICVTTPPPTITVSPSTLSVLGYLEGQGPLSTSANSFTVSGANLIGDINLSAPSNFEISTSATGPFSTSLSFSPINGVVSSSTVFVRLIEGLSLGLYSAEILTASSDGADDKTVTLNSAVYAPNDVCSGAIDVLCGSSVTVDNSFASDDVLPAVSCGSTSSGLAKGLWYKFTPLASGTVTLKTCGGSSFDTYLRVYTGSCGALSTCLGSNDDVSSACPSGTLFSSLSFSATAGTTYYVLSSIFSTTGSTGLLSLDISCPIEAPVTDNVIVCDADFTATWGSNEDPTGLSFLLDVSTDNLFTSFVPGYQALAVNGYSQTVSVPTGTYFYRVRAVRGGIESENSNTATVEVYESPTITCPDDIFVNTDADVCGATVSFTALVTGSPAPTVIYSIASGSLFSVGTTGVEVSVENECGSTSCSFNVNVSDIEAPNAVCQDVSVSLDSDGNGSITEAQVDNGSSDACGIASYTLDNYLFNCSNVGSTNTVSLSVTDNNGNSSSCSASVIVLDEVAPLAICQEVTVILDNEGNGSISAENVNNGSSDACGIATYILDNYLFNCSNTVTVNTVNLTVTDVNGNSNTCATVVTVLDAYSPIAICQDITVQLDETGNGIALAADVNNGSSDECGIASIALSQVNFACSEVGANTETLTVTDVNGNTNTCNAIVTVVDNLAPIANCQNITVQLNATGIGTTSAAAVDNNSTDNCGIASLSLSQTTFGCSEIGTNSETLTVIDVNGNVSTCETIITVEDNIAPNALCQNVEVYLDANGNGITTASAVGNLSGDNCGLLPQCTVTGPMVSCLSGLMLDKNRFDCSNIGENTVVLTVTDNYYNSSTCTAIVTVIDNIAPVALCQDLTVQLDGNGNASITASDVNNGSSDACGLASILLNKSTFDCSNLGSNNVILSVTDNNGNSSSCNSTIIIEDNVLPEALCKNATVTLTGGSASINVASVNNGSNDNCNIKTLSVSPNNFNCSNIGNNTVTLTVTDVNDNISTCLATVSVLGATPSCSITSVPTSSVYTGGNPNVIYLGYGAQSTNLVASVSGGSGFTYSWTGSNLNNNNVANPLFTPTSAGTYNFTVTITNENGCVTTCTKTICVIDIRVPGKNGSGKVYVCHIGPQPHNQNTLSISVNAVASHLAHGDYLGACGTTVACANSFTKTVETPQAVSKESVSESVSVEEKSITNDLKLNAFPNPFIINTTISFTLTENTENVRLNIFNMEGREIRQLYDGPAEANREYQFQFNAETTMESGIYFYRLQTKEGKVLVNKLIMVK